MITPLICLLIGLALGFGLGWLFGFKACFDHYAANIADGMLTNEDKIAAMKDVAKSYPWQRRD